MSAKLQKGVTDLSAVEKLAGRTRQCVQPGPRTFAAKARQEVPIPIRMLVSAESAIEGDGSVAHDGRRMWVMPCHCSSLARGGLLKLGDVHCPG